MIEAAVRLPEQRVVEEIIVLSFDDVYRRESDLLLVTSALQPLIWGGLVVLVASGLMLHPNLFLPRTEVKLVLVLVATLNGMWAHRLTERLKVHPGDATAGAVDQLLLLKVMGAAPFPRPPGGARPSSGSWLPPADDRSGGE